jgi:Tol biopolymer transport system component
MKYKSWGLLVSLTTMVVLAGCQGQAAPPVPQVTAPASPLATSVPTETVAVSPLSADQNKLSGKVVFDSDRSGTYQIYVYDVGSDSIVQLTNASGRSIEPDWSPDGQRIAFSSTHADGVHPELAVMDADGGDLKTLTSDGAFAVGAAWSPDGRFIAYHSNRTGDFEVYVIDAAGAEPTNVTNHSSGDFMPAWSPDGKALVFVSTRGGSLAIYRMAADGSGVEPLTTVASPDFYYPSFSPDGQWIVLVGSTLDTTETIYTMSADGTDLRALTDQSSNNTTPVWSRDGSKIVFSSDRDGYKQLYVMNSDGSNQAPLSTQTRGQDPAVYQQ